MAVKKGVKKKEHENLSSANIDKVIGLLEAQKPITKKEACEILNISYNTTRLTKIIEERKEEAAEDLRRRAANRGKPLVDYEKQDIIESVLDGEALSEIANRLYRSTGSIKTVIEDIGIPDKSEHYFKHAMLPEQCVADSFNVGDLVWSVAQNCIAVIEREELNKASSERVYRVYEFERLEESSPYVRWAQAGEYAGRYATYVASALGSLAHLEKYGVNLKKRYIPHFPKSAISWGWVQETK